MLYYSQAVCIVYMSSCYWRILDPSVWLLGVARTAQLWRQCRPKEEATVRESADPIQVLYCSCNGE